MQTKRNRTVRFLEHAVRLARARRALKFYGKAWPITDLADLWRADVLPVPRPVELCNGEFLVPIWDRVRERWDFTHDAANESPMIVRPRAECVDPRPRRCRYLHTEDLDAELLARPHIQAALRRGRRTPAAHFAQEDLRRARIVRKAVAA